VAEAARTSAPAPESPSPRRSRPSPVPTPAPAPTGGGEPLPTPVASAISGSLGIDTSPVRVHTDTTATSAAHAFGARAFTFGSHVFLGGGESPTDVSLMAHEVTHAVQQEAAPRPQLWTTGGTDRYESEAQQASSAVVQGQQFTVRERTRPMIQRLGISDVLDYFADKANNIPGYRMFTIVLGVNPINMSRVERSAANVLRAVIELIPGGNLITQALDKYGVIEKAGGWVEQQIKTLGMTGALFKQAISKFIDSLGWRDIFHLGDVWDRAKRIFTEPIDKLIAFGKGLIEGIIKFVKEAILKPLAALAERIPGWKLLLGTLGKNPITGETVTPEPGGLIKGFMTLIGQQEIYERIQKTNALGRVWTWFKTALGELLGFVMQLPALFINTLRSLEIMDIILLPRAIAKVVGAFGNFVVKFAKWAGGTIWKLLEIVFEVVSPGAWGYIKKTGAALRSILTNPLPFVGNLVKAAKAGFQNFASNFFTHLKNGLLDWLTGSLPGIYIPKAFELGEIVKFVFSILGLSWANIRGKLVKAVPGGETTVKAMETGFDIVVTLVTKGPAAAWDKIQAELSNLQQMVIDGIIGMVVEAITMKAVPKLIAMFIPGAGFISAIISIYDTVMVFVQKISKIIQVVTAFVDSLVTIAAGNISAASKRVESILAGLLSLAISFLAGFAGLGKIADKIMGVIAKVRAPIDKALDALIAWIVKMAKTLFKKAFGKDDKKNDQAFAAVAAAVEQAKAAGAKPEELTARISPLKRQYEFKKLEVITKGDETEIDAEINPVKIWKYGGKLKMKIIYDPSWPLDEFMSKAKAIQAAATVGKLLTLPMDPITGKQKTTKGMRKGEQDVLREKVRTFIVTKVTNKTEQQRLLGLLQQLQADHQLELQMFGGDKPGNLALCEGAMNKELGWFDFRPALRTLPPGTVISSVVIDTSAVEKQRKNHQKIRQIGTAAPLRDALLLVAVGGEKNSVRSWFKLEP
jgi:hypothetical protein